MMWIVRLALSRPYTFVVMSLLIAVMGVLSIMTMSVDIFPKINIPVVTSIWSYGGLSPTEMQDRITTIVERALTTTVNNIEHIESQSVRGNSVIKMYFQPGTDVNGSVAQVTALSQTIIKPLPVGITPPLILQYNASDVPVIMLSLGSDQLSEQELSDLGTNFIRTQLVAVQGAAVPLPYGGKTRVVNVDLDPDALYARGLSPQDVVNAMQLQNLTVAPGTAKMGPIEYDVAIDSSPAALDDLNNIPIKYVNGTLVYVRDVGFVHDGYQPQTNLVRRDGRHSVIMPVLTSGSASTLSVVSAVRALMPTVMAGMPKSLNLDYLFDQSVFVRASISGVVREGTIAACLTALMILMFLGSWRSTLIVATSIPLSIFASISVLYMLGQTLNVMTLGGLALAVGILVDDATVEIENNHRHLDMGKAIKHAILDGASEVATPAIVATLSICIVFVPIFLLTGVGGFLFSPLAMSVVFAMLASYLLSRTLVPTMFWYLMPAELRAREARASGQKRSSMLSRVSARFEAAFLRLAHAYQGALDWVLEHRTGAMVGFVAFAVLTLALFPFVGRDFFPAVDAGQLRLHVRCPPSTRIEQTEIYFSRSKTTSVR
jgi:multidrug efflux pump subunit AcrB